MIQKRYLKPIFASVGVNSIWGLSFMASKLGQEVASPFVILMYRFDIAFMAMLLPLLLGRQRLSLRGKNLKGLIVLVLCEPVIYFIGEQFGIKYTNSAFSGVMISIIPILSIILARVFLKERPTPAQWIFSLLSISGVVAITLMAGGAGLVHPEGIALLALAVVAGAGYGVISRGISAEFTVFERSFVMQLTGAVFFSAAAIAENRGDLSALVNPLMEGKFIFSVLYLGLGASVVGYSLYNYAVSHAPITYVSSMTNLATVISIAAGVLLMGEPFSLAAGVAVAVILIGIWGVQRSGVRENAKFVQTAAAVD